MPLTSINFDSLAEADLTEQIATGVPEGIFVDYKKDMYGRSDADVKEFLKDASSVDDLPKIDRDVLELPEIVVEQYGAPDSYQPALRPAFDALWNTGGYSRSRHFDANGKWKLPR